MGLGGIVHKLCDSEKRQKGSFSRTNQNCVTSCLDQPQKFNNKLLLRNFNFLSKILKEKRLVTINLDDPHVECKLRNKKGLKKLLQD